MSHTIEELWAFDLEPSRFGIRPVLSEPSREWQPHVPTEAFQLYQIKHAEWELKWPGERWRTRRAYKRRVDRFRWWLHIKLLRWGVII